MNITISIISIITLLLFLIVSKKYKIALYHVKTLIRENEKLQLELNEKIKSLKEMKEIDSINHKLLIECSDKEKDMINYILDLTHQIEELKYENQSE